MSNRANEYLGETGTFKSDTLLKSLNDIVHNNYGENSESPYSKAKLWGHFYDYIRHRTSPATKVLDLEFPKTNLLNIRHERMPDGSNPLRTILGDIHDRFNGYEGSPTTSLSFSKEVDDAIGGNNNDIMSQMPDDSETALSKTQEGRVRDLKRDSGEKTSTSRNIVFNAANKIRTDREKKMHAIFEDEIIKYVRSNKSEAVANDWLLDNQSDPDKKSEVPGFRKRLSKLDDLKGKDTKLLSFREAIEKEFTKAESREAKRDGKLTTTANVVGNGSLAAGTAVGLGEFEPTGTFNRGVDIISETPEAVGKLLDNSGIFGEGVRTGQDILAAMYEKADIPGFDMGSTLAYLSDQIDALQDTISSHASSAWIVVGLLAVGGGLKIMTKKLKDNKITLSLSEKEKLNNFINKWSVLSVTAAASPLLIALGIDKVIPQIQSWVDSIQAMI